MEHSSSTTAVLDTFVSASSIDQLPRTMRIFKKRPETPSKSRKSDPPERASGDGYPPGPQRHETVRSGPPSQSSSPASSADRATVSHDCANATVTHGLASKPGNSTPNGPPGAHQRPSQSCETPPDPKTCSTSGTCNAPPRPLLESDKQTQRLFGRSLWEKAANSLDPEDQEKLSGLKPKSQTGGLPPNGQGEPNTHGAGPSANIDIVLRKADDVKDKEGTRRPVLEKITNGVLKFKSLGDAVVQFDKSGYAALGWSVVSFGLQVTANNEDARKFALSSSEFVREYTTRYTEYETLFRGAEPDEEFDRRLVEVYKAILRYVIALDTYLRQDGLGRFSRAVVPLQDRSISQRKDEIDSADTNVTAFLPIVTYRSHKDDFAKLLKAFEAQILPQPPRSLQDCLGSLFFSEMDNRFNDIDRAAEGTCEWLPQHKEYKNWVNCDRGLLWIKGEARLGEVDVATICS
ncbi:hypothetical protein RRF57_011790 [Xylaria bambusicola]|uniref:Uncharacterized protein n=1 Tax=Xylaria bambusicola TaxID=326684 RepID=A0AAN7UYM9_9PEZI